MNISQSEANATIQQQKCEAAENMQRFKINKQHNNKKMFKMAERSLQQISFGESMTMKDSGIGATYLATSSGSSSSNTSPESDKELIPNGKPVKPLEPSKIDASSTPATLIKRPQSAASHSISFSVNELRQSPHENSTPIRLKKCAKNVVLLSPVQQPKDCLGLIKRRQKRMHACEHCNKQFDRPSLLKRHTLTHTGERPFQCRFCSKGFSTRSGVNTHERTHTGQRPYVCRICGRRFAAGSNLIFHKYTHSNTRRHACSQCPKAFVTPGDLRKHEYTHNGEWPFRCSVCDRGFATERNMKSHEVTHSGRKPHICSHCGKGYAQESSLKTHLRIHQTINESPIEVVKPKVVELSHSVDSTLLEDLSTHVQSNQQYSRQSKRNPISPKRIHHKTKSSTPALPLPNNPFSNYINPAMQSMYSNEPSAFRSIQHYSPTNDNNPANYCLPYNLLSEQYQHALYNNLYRMNPLKPPLIPEVFHPTHCTLPLRNMGNQMILSYPIQETQQLLPYSLLHQDLNAATSKCLKEVQSEALDYTSKTLTKLECEKHLQ